MTQWCIWHRQKLKSQGCLLDPRGVLPQVPLYKSHIFLVMDINIKLDANLYVIVIIFEFFHIYFYLQGTGTVRPKANFSGQNEAEVLRKAMKGIGKDS